MKDASIPTRDRQYSYWLVPLAALDLSTGPRLCLDLDLYWIYTEPRMDLDCTSNSTSTGPILDFYWT